MSSSLANINKNLCWAKWMKQIGFLNLSEYLSMLTLAMNE